MPTQSQYNISKQNTRNLDIKIYLLNYKFQIVDELSGVTTSYPTFSNNSTSDIRRTCNISFVLKDTSFSIEEGNKIWLDKYLNIYIGVKESRTQEIVWNNMGIYIINSPNQSYNATDNTISIQGVDLMAKMTGLRNGQLSGITYTIKQNSNVRNAIISTIALAGFTKYIIEDLPISIPYDINVDRGGTVYDILKQINEIYPNYQMYFDVDGVFHFEKIPSGYNEQIMIDDDLWNNNLIAYSKSTNFEDVKNVIEVYGKAHDVDNYGGTATVSGNTYNITVADLTELLDGLLFGFTTTSSIYQPQLKINNFSSYPIKNEDGTYPTLSSSETYYCVIYKKSEGYYKFLGELEPSAILKDENPESPFYVNGKLGEIRKIFSGGEYDNINSDYLAKIRAKYELYNYCKLQDSINLTVVPIYWLDVNWVIRITLPNKNGKEETNLYIIKNISTNGGVSGTQTISCMRYYPLYPLI